LKGLNEEEAKIYNVLEELEHEAFHILRDLAMQPRPQREPMTFFVVQATRRSAANRSQSRESDSEAI
jgi:hypothetical protein